MSDETKAPPTAEDKAKLRVNNPDAPADMAPKVLAAASGGNKRLMSLRALMNESLMQDRVLVVMAGKDDALWGASQLAAAIDYLMGCGMTHDEIQAAVTAVWEESLPKLHEFNGIVEKAVADGKDPVKVLEEIEQRETAQFNEASKTAMVNAIQKVLAEAAGVQGNGKDPDFGVPELPGLRGKDGKLIVH